jgi:hypothetical protein
MDMHLKVKISLHKCEIDNLFNNLMQKAFFKMKIKY